MISRFSKIGIVVPLVIAVICSMATSANAQQPRQLLRGNMIPGQASQIRLMGNPANIGKVQPVKVLVPDAVELSVVSNGSFIISDQPSYLAGMQLGSLYRFRIVGVDVGTPFELYPSIELLDFLHPPEGLENDFPIPVVITESDVKEAAAGRLVTKVIYCEDPETALPRMGKKEDQPWFDVSASEDPVRTAAGLGRPMAILRIGSRVPTQEELANSTMNAFNSETPVNASESMQPGLRINPKYQMLATPNSDPNTTSTPSDGQGQ